MQCNWQVVTRLSVRSIDTLRRRVSLPTPFHRAFSRVCLTGNISLHRTSLLSRTLNTGAYQPSERLAAADIPLTSQQLSRAAAKAIRYATNSNNFEEANLILQAILHPELIRKSTPSSAVDPQFESVLFLTSKRVSPRLPSHALLNGLIRVGLVDTASQLAENLMSSGVRIRSRTLEAIFDGLAVMPKRPNPESNFPRDTLLQNLEQLSARDSATNFALNLLLLARKSRQRRTHKMFKTLMTLCIINGEIIICSLLFGILVKDYQSRLVDSPSSPSTEMTPFPSWNRMKGICDFVDYNLSRDHTDDLSRRSFSESLQALANLASLLDQRLIPLHNISPLLASMYKTPREPDKVWIRHKETGELIEVKAYAYFHGVLKRLINFLPTHLREHNRSLRDGTRRCLLPPLNNSSCNALLHYSLFHRCDPPRAEIVLDYMLNRRHEPLLEAPTDTLIILWRFKPLLLKWDSKMCLDVLQKSDFESPQSELPLSERKLTDIKDQFTLTYRIAELISSGSAQVVVDAIPSLLPGLTYSGYLEKQTITQTYDWDEYKSQGLQHAISLGPVIFTSLLHALQKTGKTSIAERVWKWAKKAEALSWEQVDDRNLQIKPWCLPIHAYTIMIKVYAAEAKKGWSHFQNPAEYPLLGKLERPKKWGKLKIAISSMPPRGRQSRSELGREMGLHIYNSMPREVSYLRHRINELSQQGIKIKSPKEHLQIPRPDSRFFNSILEIVGRQKPMTLRRIKHSRWLYLGLLRRTINRFITSGAAYYIKPDPALIEVAKDIAAAGYNVPIIFQRLLVGRWENAGDVPPGQIIPRDRRRFAVSTHPPRFSLNPLGIVRIPILVTKSNKEGVVDLGKNAGRGRRKNGFNSSQHFCLPATSHTKTLVQV